MNCFTYARKTSNCQLLTWDDRKKKKMIKIFINGYFQICVDNYIMSFSFKGLNA